MLHNIFRTPAPPGDAFAQDASHVLVVMTILIPISLGFLAFAIFESKRFKTSIPIGLVVADIFCVVPEAVNNYLGGVHWTQSHDPKQLLFMLMGRELDYCVAFIWWSLSSDVGVTLYAALEAREEKEGKRNEDSWLPGSYNDAAWGARTSEAVAGTGGGLSLSVTKDAA
ncbi:unnamed protein product [Aureobasidium pullulans]|nr:unnamed protein product [Aureobasidium pullulans]